MMDYSVIVEGVAGDEAALALYSTVHGAGRVMSRTEAGGKKKWSKGNWIVKSKGKIDFDAVKEEMEARSIELRGAGADEAPACYKKLSEVLEYQCESVKVIHRLHYRRIVPSTQNSVEYHEPNNKQS